ncbi:hypothetical protein QJS10_CPB21g00340 [Acorus calamus]|uniref:RNA polymerase sigma-70 region 3 domain-containing protein n=1 Tax=Acorus calamus TaxID=4465 RepID=A0AAV9C6X3_ACOCL|nr:hypothetical protein QJS10_CPB21g00340 [Acorus calamus]
METLRSLVSTAPPLNPPKSLFRNSLTSSVSVLSEQAGCAVAPVRSTLTIRHFPASVLLQEQRDDLRSSYILKEDRITQVTVDRRKMVNDVSLHEMNECDLDEVIKSLERQSLHWPNSWNLLPSLHAKDKPFSTVPMVSTMRESDGIANTCQSQKKQNNPTSVGPGDVLSLAKQAMMASKEAVSLAENINILPMDFDECLYSGLTSEQPANGISAEAVVAVRSKKLAERRLKKRRVSRNPKDITYDASSSVKVDIKKKLNKGFDPNDPLRLFLWGPETTQLLTVKEEKDLFVQIQDLMRLEEVKQKLHLQFNREPTLVEWAKAVGMSCRVLKSCLHTGNRSRNKMIYANSRLVVHVAKQYQGMGLSIGDLLQENVFALLKKVKAAKRLCILKGHHPTNIELARQVGITVEKLETLFVVSRNPVSIQERPWLDQQTTFQEIIADPEIEIPEQSIGKEMMRRHVRGLLGILNPKERQIIRSRFGIGDGSRSPCQRSGMCSGCRKRGSGS